MNVPNNGGPAFPVPNEANVNQQEGMSMRDYFAGQALTGMLAYPGCIRLGSHHNNNTPDGVALMAYEYADAMIAARPLKEQKP